MYQMVFGILILAMLGFEGLKQIVTGKYSGKQERYEKYTPESVALSARVSGVFSILTGVGFFLFRLKSDQVISGIPGYVYLIAAGVCFVLYIVCYYAIPKKKGADYVAPANSKDDDNETYIDED